MACNCVNEIANRIQKELSEKNPAYKDMNIIHVECNCFSFIERDNKLCREIAIPFSINHEPIGRKKKTTIYMTTKYCPFCGKKYAES